MPDYKKMYYILLNETTNAIESLQKAQQIAKTLYNDSDDTQSSKHLENEHFDFKISNK